MPRPTQAQRSSFVPALPVAVALVAVALSATACRAPARAYADKGAFFGAYLGPLDRDQQAGDPIADAFLVGGALGQELMRGPVRPAFEIDGSWSYHDVDLVGGDPDTRVTLGRLGVGARISVDLMGVTPYVRGGGFFRWDNGLRNARGSLDEGPDIESQSERGVYYGGGIEFWIDGVGTVGPAVTWYDGHGDLEVDEFFIGLVGHTHF